MDPDFLIVLKRSIKYIALLSAIIATIFYPKYKHGNGKYFLFPIWFIVLTEFSFRFVYYTVLKEQHKVFFISNIHYLVMGSFYLLWYRSLLGSIKRKRIVLFLLIVFLLFFIIDSVFIESFFLSQNYTAIALSITVTIAIFLFFIEILQTEKILRFERTVYFWFSLGILIFWVPYIPLKFTSTYFNFEGATYTLSIFTLNFLMHLFFMIGVLWSKKKYNY